MKLVVAIVQAEDAGGLIRGLTDKGHRATRINTAGGFLREGNATVLIGAEAKEVEGILALIDSRCQSRTRYLTQAPTVGGPVLELPASLPIAVPVGGATVFVLDVEQFARL